MDLTHSFTVPASLEETWRAFLDIEDVAGCFPGATVTSVEGDDFKGTCKVKLGPISLVYAGSGSFLERDEAAHRFVLEAKGKDKRGNGTAGATVTAVMTEAAAKSTDVEVKTNLSITGKPAQFGRGVIQDVSDKLLQQFMVCLESKVGAPAAPAPAEAAAEAPAGAPAEGAAAGAPAAAPKPVPGEVPGGAAAAGAAGAATGAAAAPAAPVGAAAEKAPAAATEALDLGATVLPILLKNYWKQLAGAALVLFVLWRLLRRRR